jgi:hypothetical protein
MCVTGVGFSKRFLHHLFLPINSEYEHQKEREQTGRSGDPIGKQQSLSERL